MKFLVIGDLHLGKSYFPMLRFEQNPNFNFEKYKNFSNLWTSRSIDYIMNVFDLINIEFSNQDIEIVFLGDVLDSAKTPEETMDLYFKFGLLDKMLNKNPNCRISIVVGNHDKNTKLQKINSSKLSSYHNYRSRVVVYEESYMNEERNLLYVPYIRFDLLFKNLSQYSKQTFKEIIIFSHNRIYINDFFRKSRTYSRSEIHNLFSQTKIVMFNGHIHNHYYEKDFFLTGSVSPTSMKDDFQSSGLCFYDSETKELRTYKNNKISFLSIWSRDHLESLFEMLNFAKESGCHIALRLSSDLKRDLKGLCKNFSETIVAFSY